MLVCGSDTFLEEVNNKVMHSCFHIRPLPWIILKGGLNDVVISNNNDAIKVLSTVYQTVLLFVKHFPEAYILMVGSSKSRTRLYQMAITKI